MLESLVDLFFVNCVQIFLTPQECLFLQDDVKEETIQIGFCQYHWKSQRRQVNFVELIDE